MAKYKIERQIKESASIGDENCFWYKVFKREGLRWRYVTLASNFTDAEGLVKKLLQNEHIYPKFYKIKNIKAQYKGSRYERCAFIKEGYRGYWHQVCWFIQGYSKYL